MGSSLVAQTIATDSNQNKNSTLKIGRYFYLLIKKNPPRGRVPLILIASVI
jgi:hypothetical protein